MLPIFYLFNPKYIHLRSDIYTIQNYPHCLHCNRRVTIFHNIQITFLHQIIFRFTRIRIRISASRYIYCFLDIFLHFFFCKELHKASTSRHHAPCIHHSVEIQSSETVIKLETNDQFSFFLLANDIRFSTFLISTPTASARVFGFPCCGFNYFSHFEFIPFVRYLGSSTEAKGKRGQLGFAF